MRRILLAIGITLAAFGCKSLLEVTVKTTPVNAKAPVVGYGTQVGKVILYVEKYLPFEDVPSNIVEIRDMKTYWKDSSATSSISYTIWFSDTGYVAKDPDSVKLYASLECTADAATCAAYENILQAAGYNLEDPDTTFRQKLIFGTTQPGRLTSHEYQLPQEAVDVMDRALVKGGVYQLIQISLDSTLIPTDTLYLKDLYQEITIGVR